MEQFIRNAQMKILRLEEGLTYAEIGDRFGVTRERVRQIIGNTGRGFRLQWTENHASDIDVSALTRDEIQNLPGIGYVWTKMAGKTRHAIKPGDGSTQKGNATEIRASEILSQKGYPNTLMPLHHPFDILLDNGYRIEVKSATKTICPKSQKAYPYYNIGHLKNGEDCDFFFISIPETIFIVPSSEFSALDYIRIMYPPRRKTTRMDQYLNAFDLLKTTY